MEGGTFGAAVDSKDNAWLTSYGSKSITVFDKNGKPLTPSEGITFDGKLGLMQGVIVTPSGDVWVLGVEKSQLVYFPKGDLAAGRIVCEGDSAEPCKSFKAPFHLAIDKQDRIWVSNSALDHVTRFPAADPSKAEKFKTGFNNSGLAIDSQGNVWITERFGSGLLGLAHLIDFDTRLKLQGVAKALARPRNSRPDLTYDSQGNVWITERFGSGLLGLAHLIDFDTRLKLQGVAKASDYLTKTMSERWRGRYWQQIKNEEALTPL